MNKKLKSFLIGTWEVLVIVVYVNFYIMCLTSFIITIALAMYILNEAGADITGLGYAMKFIGYLGVFYIAVIMVDKIFKMKVVKE